MPNCISKPLLGAPSTHDAFWALVFSLIQAHTLSWCAHALGLHAHTSGPCPCFSPHSQGSILSLFPHCTTAGHTLCQPGLCRHLQQHSVFSTHSFPPPGAARQGEWKLVGTDNACIILTTMAWLNLSVCAHPSCFLPSGLKDLPSEALVSSMATWDRQ